MNRILVGILLVFNSCIHHPYEHGKRIYDTYCSNCHMPDGMGLRKLIPPLADSDYLKANQSILPCIILHGQSGEILVNGVMYQQTMPSAELSDIQVNNLINYINNAWGNSFGEMTIMETQSRISDCYESNDQ